MIFKWEINLGTVLELLTFLFVVLNGARKLGALEEKVNIVYGWFQEQIINQHSNTKSRRQSTSGD